MGRHNRKKNAFRNRAGKQTGVASPTSKSATTRVDNVKLNPNNPIPIGSRDSFLTTWDGVDYLPFLNEDDNFANILLEAKLLSTTNKLCVNSKSKYCLGQGWYFNDLREKKEKYKDFSNWAASVNRSQHSLNDILGKAFNTKNTWGNGYVEIVRGSVGKKKFMKVYVRNTLDCRLSMPDEYDTVNSVLISKYFREKGFWKGDVNEVSEVPIYSNNALDDSWWEDEKGNQHTIIHLKDDEEGVDYYGMPTNIASLPYQLLEYNAARYNLDNFENNLVLGGVIAIKGNVTEAEANKLGKKIVYQHSGNGKRGRYVVLSNEQGLEGVDIQNFEKQIEGSYIELDEHTENKIVSANDWDPYLAGIHRNTGLSSGGVQYLKSIFDIKNETVIKPAQKNMIEKLLTPLINIYDEWFGTSWSDHEIALSTVLPASFIGEIDINKIITVDEGRKIAGKPDIGPEKGGDRFIDDGSSKNNKKGGDDVQTQ